MTGQWKYAALGALGGAVLATATVFGAALTGNFPGTGDDHIRAYLLAHPDILADMNERLQAQQNQNDEHTRQLAVDKLGPKAFFDPKIAFITGPANAKTTLVEFFDYNCPFCRASLPAVRNFYAKHKSDARFAFIEFPIKGDEFIVAARAALAARNQPDKYLPFHFALMNEEGFIDEKLVYADAQKVGLDVDKLKADMKDPAIAKAVDQSLALAHRARVDGTPAFIINGRAREGMIDDNLLNQLAKS